MITIGIVANPASGKDVRRLVARASVFDNPEKQAIVRRALTGMQSVLRGAEWRLAYLDDGHGIVRRALEEFVREDPDGAPEGLPVVSADTLSARDTVAAARALADIPSSVNLTLGGDGTNRAFATGWPDAPLIPISTGTNNVFPRLIEATVAGTAAGLVAGGLLPLEAVAEQQKLIRVQIDGEPDDIALIDAVLVADRFVGSRALLTPGNLRSALLTVADPAGVGITAIGGLLSPLGARADRGLHLEFGAGGIQVNAPIAPGLYRTVEVSAHQPVDFSQTLKCKGPGVLAFDGERERVLKPGQEARLTIERSGPHVIDVPTALRLAAERGFFLKRGNSPPNAQAGDTGT
jgi:hypothetical protein